MSRFTEAKRNEIATAISRQMKTAASHMTSFANDVQAVKTKWAAYVATDPDPSELTSAGLEFAAKCVDLVDNNKTRLAHALDVIAAGMVDGEGQPLTRQDVLDIIAEIPAAGE